MTANRFIAKGQGDVMTKLFAVVLLLMSCNALRPGASTPQFARIQTDAGPKVCEYVEVELDGHTAQVGICADDSEGLRVVATAAKTAYPIVREILQ